MGVCKIHPRPRRINELQIDLRPLGAVTNGGDIDIDLITGGCTRQGGLLDQRITGRPIVRTGELFRVQGGFRGGKNTDRYADRIQKTDNLSHLTISFKNNVCSEL